MPDRGEQVLTQEQAYEAAYWFVWQYAEREPTSVSLQLMLVAMETTAAHRERTNDPASWEDWLRCVRETVDVRPVPRYPSTEPGPGPEGHLRTSDFAADDAPCQKRAGWWQIEQWYRSTIIRERQLSRRWATVVPS